METNFQIIAPPRGKWNHLVPGYLNSQGLFQEYSFVFRTSSQYTHLFEKRKHYRQSNHFFSLFRAEIIFKGLKEKQSLILEFLRIKEGPNFFVQLRRFLDVSEKM